MLIEKNKKRPKSLETSFNLLMAGAERIKLPIKILETSITPYIGLI